MSQFYYIFLSLWHLLDGLILLLCCIIISFMCGVCGKNGKHSCILLYMLLNTMENICIDFFCDLSKKNDICSDNREIFQFSSRWFFVFVFNQIFLYRWGCYSIFIYIQDDQLHRNMKNMRGIFYNNLL